MSELRLFDTTNAVPDEGDLSPAVRRYLPGVGREWLRTRGGCAVRLSREGSGRAKIATQPDAVDVAENKKLSPVQRALQGWSPTKISSVGHYLGEEQ